MNNQIYSQQYTFTMSPSDKDSQYDIVNFEIDFLVDDYIVESGHQKQQPSDSDPIADFDRAMKGI